MQGFNLRRARGSMFLVRARQHQFVIRSLCWPGAGLESDIFIDRLRGAQEEGVFYLLVAEFDCCDWYVMFMYQFDAICFVSRL